ncbi:MAG TPA: hypothetical protein VMU38_05425 [Candidatus Binatia bacterium]|nr:hypothetical protein [Candidatus Binatia bacterium]
MMHRLIATAGLVSSLAATCANAAAQASPAPAPSPTPSAPADPCGSLLSIVNRPTVTTGVCTVRPGHVLLENGYTNTTTTGTGGGSSALYPQSVLRVGTFDPHLDFEFGFPSAETSSVGQPRITGATDISLASRYELGYSASGWWGIYGAVTMPTGSKAFTAGNAQFTGDLDGAYAINSEFSLAGTLSFNAFSAANAAGLAQSYFAFVPSLELSAALPGGPSQISAEYAYFSASGPGLPSKSLLDFIYQRDFGNHVQFDVEYGFSPTTIDGQRQHYIGGGLSFMN